VKLERWERQPGESDPAWAAFVVYRDLPPSERSISRVVSDTGKSRSLIAGWSSRWDWKDRAAQYDRHMDRQATRREIEAIAKMKENHLILATNAQAHLARWIKDVLPGLVPTLTPREFVMLMEFATGLERKAYGDPGEISDFLEPLDPEVPDLEKELEPYIEAINEMHRKGYFDVAEENADETADENEQSEGDS
jgi:hypothetical protein